MTVNRLLETATSVSFQRLKTRASTSSSNLRWLASLLGEGPLESPLMIVREDRAGDSDRQEDRAETESW